LTNNSAPTPRELQSKLQRLGIDVTEDHFFTSGQSTAYFLKSQMPEVKDNAYPPVHYCINSLFTLLFFSVVMAVVTRAALVM
jgi:hypothetical protein